MKDVLDYNTLWITTISVVIILFLLAVYSFFTIRFLKEKRKVYKDELIKANEALGNKDTLLNILKTAIANKPVAILSYKEKFYLKNTFEVKQDGDIKCRIKSSGENGKRIPVIGELAFRTVTDNKYIPARDLGVILSNTDKIAIQKLYNSKIEILP